MSESARAEVVKDFAARAPLNLVIGGVQSVLTDVTSTWDPVNSSLVIHMHYVPVDPRGWFTVALSDDLGSFEDPPGFPAGDAWRDYR